jgi:hypothetical protein
MAQSQADAALTLLAAFARRYGDRPWPENDAVVHVLEPLATVDQAKSNLSHAQGADHVVFEDGSALQRVDGAWRRAETDA